MDNKTINLELTAQEFNTIVSALQEMPYRLVTELINNCIKQAQSQVSSQETEKQ